MANRVFGNGITVTLYEKTEAGVDAFNNQLYTEQPTDVANVLVSPVSSTEQTEMTNLYGKQAVYVLAIPKGDAHVWEDCKIEFFGQTFHSFREEVLGIEHLIPGPWNKKVWVEINE